MTSRWRTTLVQDLLLVLDHPEDYGFESADGGLSLLDCLEALVARPRWLWLPADALIEVAELAPEVRVDGLRVFALADSQADEGSRGVAESNDVAKTLFLPLPDLGCATPPLGSHRGWEQLITDRAQAPLVRLYDSVETALNVSWALSGHLPSAGVGLIRIEHLHQPRRCHYSPRLVVTSRPRFDTIMALPPADLAEIADRLQITVWHKEALYFDDPPGYALRKLRACLRADQIGDLFLPYLSDDDPEVRAQALMATGIIPFTANHVLALADAETDQGVLETMVWALSSAKQSGSIDDGAVEALVRLIEPRLSSQEAIADVHALLTT